MLLFRDKVSFYGEEFSTPRPTPKLEVHCPCLFNIFAASLHIGGRSSIRNLSMRHAVVTGTHNSTTHLIVYYIHSKIRRLAVWSISRRNCLLKDVIEEKIEERRDAGRRRRRKHLQNDPVENG